MIALRLAVLAVLAAAIVGDALYVARVGRPGRYPDRALGWFMASIGMAAIGSHTVLALFASGILRGDSAGWAFVAAGSVEVVAIWWRWWMAGQAVPKLKAPRQKRERAMMVKISPEIVRLVTAITAGLQLFAAMLTGTDVISPSVLVVLVAVGASLQAALAAYGQGVQTNPPAGMLTEERARELSAPPERDPADMEAPAAYETGRASIPAIPAGSDRYA